MVKIDFLNSESTFVLEMEFEIEKKRNIPTLKPKNFYRLLTCLFNEPWIESEPKNNQIRKLNSKCVPQPRNIAEIEKKATLWLWNQKIFIAF